MAVSIDTVYQRVLLLANKEQRGYITPQEFNLLANQAQMEIFEQYFYDINQFNKVPGNTQQYSDMLTLLYEKLETFETQKDNSWMATNMPDGPPGSAVFGQNIGFRIPRQEIYRVGEVFYGFRSCEMLNAKDFRLAMMSPLTSPSASAPIATMSSLVVGKSSGLSSNYLSVAIAGYKYNFTPSPSTPTSFITPSSSLNAMSISYTRRPVDVQWSYVVINDKPLYNDNVSIDFELHSSEETELVYKILKLAGVNLKAQEVVQVGQALEQTQIQQEKQ